MFTRWLEAMTKVSIIRLDAWLVMCNHNGILGRKSLNGIVLLRSIQFAWVVKRMVEDSRKKNLVRNEQRKILKWEQMDRGNALLRHHFAKPFFILLVEEQLLCDNAFGAWVSTSFFSSHFFPIFDQLLAVAIYLHQFFFLFAFLQPFFSFFFSLSLRLAKCHIHPLSLTMNVIKSLNVRICIYLCSNRWLALLAVLKHCRPCFFYLHLYFT